MIRSLIRTTLVLGAVSFSAVPLARADKATNAETEGNKMEKKGNAEEKAANAEKAHAEKTIKKGKQVEEAGDKADNKAQEKSGERMQEKGKAQKKAAAAHEDAAEQMEKSGNKVEKAGVDQKKAHEKAETAPKK